MEAKRFEVTISTDGACSGNPGPGGYAAIIRFGDHVKTVTGNAERTTNNKMELMALIDAVKALKKPCKITFRTDSQYICNGIACAKERSENGWRTKTGAKCANAELWQELADLRESGNHRFKYFKVEGHSGDPDNEKCDKLAKEQIRMIKKGE